MVRTGHLFRWLVAAQLTALAVLGIVTVARFHVWSPIDERAHFAYVQTVAEQGRLPRVEDPAPELHASVDTPLPPNGISGRDYEAFQPPLYYVAAVPAFALVHGRRGKIFALRAFDLALVALAALLLALLARRELPDAPLAALAGGLTVLLWPGVLVRGVTVSNLPLELVVATALLLALARGRLVRAGVLLGVCLLTKLTLVYLAVPFAIVLLRRVRTSPRRVAAAALLPAVVLAPWLTSNVVRLGTLTANAQARAQQAPVMNPSAYQYRVGDVRGRFEALFDGVLPQEWIAQQHVTWVRALVLLLLALLLGGAILLARRGETLALAGSALAAGVAIAVGTLLVSNWDIFLLRYFYAVLPALAVGVTAAAYRTIGPRVVGAALTLTTLALGALWVDMAGAFYFTDLGHRLGI